MNMRLRASSTQPRLQTSDDAALLERLVLCDARENFWTFRRYIHPELIDGWWQRSIAAELQRFYNDLVAGKRPILVLQSPPQHGKVVSDDCAVLSSRGWTTHGQLKIGDRIFSPSGKTVRVEQVHRKLPTRVRVELTNGEVFYVHEEHLWTVYNRYLKKWQTLETQEMMKRGLFKGEEGKRGCHYQFQLPLVEPLLGEEKNLPADPYMLGVWLGDGTSAEAKITYGKRDVGIVDAVTACGFSSGSTHETPIGSGVYRTYFKGGMLAQLRAANVLNNKHVPEFYLTASLRQRLELLAGLIDTDGYIYPKNGRVVFVTGDKQLADTFCQLVATFGWRTSVDTVAPSMSSSGIQGKKDCFYVGFQPTLEIPCRIPRKRLLVRAVRRRIAIKNITVEENCTKIGNCIKVSAEDGLYLIGHSLQPTHNTTQVTDFISYVSGRDPNLKTIYASYGDDLGVRTNTELQRIYDGDRFKKVFGQTKISSSNIVSLTHRYQRNSSMIEFVNHRGSFRNTTVGGQITGLGLDLGVVDDPVKGRAEAQSLLVRDKTYAWFTDDFFSRFSEKAGLVIICTRWHSDDVVGRFQNHFPDARVLKYPAIAEEDEEFRLKGEPLFPELKSLRFLNERKALMTEASWAALYQQNPYILGGGIFPVEKFRIVNTWDNQNIRASIRYWDKSASLDGDYTAGVLMHHMNDGRFVIEHVVRGQWLALDREEKIKFWTRADESAYKYKYKVVVEQEPGSGGKESVEATIRNLAGYTVIADKVTGAKEVRAEPYAAQVQGGNVWLLAGEWHMPFLDEHELFPMGKHDDMVDAAAGAFAYLTMGSQYNLDHMQ